MVLSRDQRVNSSLSHWYFPECSAEWRLQAEICTGLSKNGMKVVVGVETVFVKCLGNTAGLPLCLPRQCGLENTVGFRQIRRKRRNRENGENARALFLRELNRSLPTSAHRLHDLRMDEALLKRLESEKHRDNTRSVKEGDAGRQHSDATEATDRPDKESCEAPDCVDEYRVDGRHAHESVRFFLHLSIVTQMARTV